LFEKYLLIFAAVFWKQEYRSLRQCVSLQKMSGGAVGKKILEMTYKP